MDVGSGAGFDTFLAAGHVGPAGRVVGVDMTPEMLEKARATASELRLEQVEFREGPAEALPVDDGWADVVISNGVINLCADKRAVLSEMCRVLEPGGWLQFADIANGRPVPEGALRDIDLWTGWTAGGLPRAGWQKLLTDIGFTDVAIGEPVDIFGGAAGQKNARAHQVYGYPLLARKPR